MAETLTLAELSEETGESMQTLRRWSELGLLPADSAAFDRRHVELVGLIRFAVDRGFTAEALARHLSTHGDLLDTFVDTLSSGTTRSYSFEEAAARAGVQAELLEEMRTAAGLRDQRRAHEEDIEAMGWIAMAIGSGMPKEAVLQIVRVLADTSARAADAINRLFHAYVHEAFRVEGKSGAELTEATQSVARPLQDVIEPAVMYFHRKALARALREDLLLHLAEETTGPASVPGEMDRTMLFVDLAGFTPLTEAMGDAAAAKIVDRFSNIVRDAAARHHGQVIKQIGDEFMVVFSDPADAVGCALSIERATGEEPRFPAVRSGLHAGTVLYREGDYVGSMVNVAARVAATARAHEVLVTETVRSRATEIPGVEFREFGRHELKGVPEPVELYLAESRSERPRRVRDPVCGMELEPQHAAAELSWEGRPYWFCSADCLQRFVATPERFAAG